LRRVVRHRPLAVVILTTCLTVCLTTTLTTEEFCQFRGFGSTPAYL